MSSMLCLTSLRVRMSKHMQVKLEKSHGTLIIWLVSGIALPGEYVFRSGTLFPHPLNTN